MIKALNKGFVFATYIQAKKLADQILKEMVNMVYGNMKKNRSQLL